MQLPSTQVSDMVHQQGHVSCSLSKARARPPTEISPGIYVVEAQEDERRIAQEETTGSRHEKVTRRGTNAYIDMEACLDCGTMLKKELKYGERSEPMQVKTPSECEHLKVSWAGTNAYIWKWSCSDCGQPESINKTGPNDVHPIPGRS